jgi:adenosine deaminase/adenosine deaminase CECR1
VPFVLSTDDAGVSRNNLSGEYVLYAARYKPDYAEIKKLSIDSIRYSFLKEADKQQLLKDMRVKFSQFEAAIAAAAQVKPR